MSRGAYGRAPIGAGVARPGETRTKHDAKLNRGATADEARHFTSAGFGLNPRP